MQRDNIIGTLHSNERVNGGLSPRERLQGLLSIGGGVSSYNELTDLPTVNGYEFIGDMTSEDLGIWQPKDFSTTEQNTGLKWIDGKDIYFKTYDNLSVSSTNMSVSVSDLNIDTLIDLKALYYSSQINMHIVTSYDDGGDWLNTHMYNNGIRTLCTSWFVNKFTYKIVLFYTKN